LKLLRFRISVVLTLYPLTTSIVAALRNAIKWQMGFYSAFKGLKAYFDLRCSLPEAPIPHFMVSGNNSVRVTSKPFGAKSAIFTKMWVGHLWRQAPHFKYVSVVLDKHESSRDHIEYIVK
jgi:hypothetical protein